MRKITVELTGAAPLLQSRFHNVPKLNKEAADAYEARTWHLKCHFNSEDHVYIPAFALKKSIQEVAKYLSLQVPGKGKATYTKHFRSGVLVTQHAFLYGANGKPILMSDLRDENITTCMGQEIFVNSDGVSGSGKRVMRTFPHFAPGWKAVVDYIITDDVITSSVFLEHLNQSGLLIGIGAFRCGNGGINGSYVAKVLEVIDDYMPSAA